MRTKDESWLTQLCLLALCALYLVAAFGKLADLAGVVSDLRLMGAPAPGLWALLWVATLLVAPALVLLFPGPGRRIGAWWLAVFELGTGLVSYPFWRYPEGAAILPAVQGLLGHVAVVGGLVYVAGRTARA